jgi:hypothetical protein
MSSNRSSWLYWVSAWLPVAVGMAVILMESTEALGAEHTSGPLRWLFEAIFGHVANARWALIHHVLRKSGHFLGYGRRAGPAGDGAGGQR